MTNNYSAKILNRRLILIGAGDLGREICDWFPELKVSAFLDSHLTEWGYPGLPPIIGKPETYAPQRDDIFLCTIGNPATRLSVSRDFEARGAEFATLVHETAMIPASSSIGKGTIILPNVIIDINSHVGKHCLMYFRAGVGHDARLGDGCVILSNAVVGSRCHLGEGVAVSTLAFCNTGISIGDYAQIGANTFAARDVPPFATALGVPARIVHAYSDKPAIAATASAEGQARRVDQ